MLFKLFLKQCLCYRAFLYRPSYSLLIQIPESMLLSPGLEFIGQSLAYLLLPCVIIFGSLTVLCDFLALPIPRWALVIGTLFSRLAYLRLKPSLENRKNAKNAKAFGAVLPPHIHDGQLEAINKVMENFKSGYPGL